MSKILLARKAWKLALDKSHLTSLCCLIDYWVLGLALSFGRTKIWTAFLILGQILVLNVSNQSGFCGKSSYLESCRVYCGAPFICRMHSQYSSFKTCTHSHVPTKTQLPVVELQKLKALPPARISPECPSLCLETLSPHYFSTVCRAGYFPGRASFDPFKGIENYLSAGSVAKPYHSQSQKMILQIWAISWPLWIKCTSVSHLNIFYLVSSWNAPRSQTVLNVLTIPSSRSTESDQEQRNNFERFCIQKMKWGFKMFRQTFSFQLETKRVLNSIKSAW